MGLLIATSGKIPTVRSVSEVESGAVCFLLTLEHSKRPQFVTSLQVSRAEAETTGLGAPEGFVIEALPYDQRTDPKWVDNWNALNIRFVGRLELPPGKAVPLRFPVVNLSGSGVTVKGRFVNGRRLFGTMGFFEATVPPRVGA